MGKKAIVVMLLTGLCFGFLQVYIKFSNPEFALTHWFNDMSYYIKVGFVILIMSAVFLHKASPNLVGQVLWVLGVALLIDRTYQSPADEVDHCLHELTSLLDRHFVAASRERSLYGRSRYGDLGHRCSSSRWTVQIHYGPPASFVASGTICLSLVRLNT